MEEEALTQEVIIKNDLPNVKAQENLLLEPTEENKSLFVTQSHVDEWEKIYLKQGHSYISTKTYLSFIRRFVGPKTEISQKTVNKFRANNMSAGCVGALKSFFVFLTIHHDFPDSILNIRFDKSKPNKKDVQRITHEEFNKIYEGMTEFGMKDKMLTLVLYSCALRLSEGLKLTWQDVNWSEWLKDRTKQGILTIKNSKRNKNRFIPVSPEFLNIIYDNHKERTPEGIPTGGLIFDFNIMDYHKPGQTLERTQYDYLNYVKNRYRDILKKVSLKAIGRKIHPHVYRHAKAQDIMDHDVPIEVLKEYLGHESIISTQVYARASPEKIRRDMEVYQKQDKIIQEAK